MPESNIDNYRIEQYSMRFVGYTASSVANPNPVEGESRALCSGTAQVTLCSGTAQVVNVCNFHLSKITWNCVSASLKIFFIFRPTVSKLRGKNLWMSGPKKLTRTIVLPLYSCSFIEMYVCSISIK